MGKSKKAQIPEWLPNWQDETQYPDPEETSLRGWAWEFLRRNAEYGKLWDRFASLPSVPVHHDFSAEDIRERLEKDFGVLLPAAPSLNSSHSDFQNRPVFVRHGRMWLKPVDWPSDLDPYVADACALELGEDMIQFDLRWPMEPQLRAIRSVLKAQSQHLQDLGIID